MSIDKLSSALARTLQPVAPNQAPGVAEAKSGERADAVDPTTMRNIERAAAQIDSYMKSVNRSLEFRVDKDSGRTVVSVRDAETGELIRQIPGEEVLRMARYMDTNSLLVSITA